ncbi:IS630 family transposase [Neisseria sp. ZJ106]|uniref:IS630 family transposase n=2 Tax=Neisseria lisongii TaxID=2912188 RepID=A0ABY7RJJ2_9NEIS|nr:IS630 family transposase [Neisseria lisongii]MCF7521604.1 IS630 family transposase [Neisseria lisongii]WCL71794.1 IS630 family transposase [Neisseria lisongii]
MPIATNGQSGLTVQPVLFIKHCKNTVSAEKKTNKHPKANVRLRRRFIRLKHRFHLKKRPIVCLDESGFRTSVHRPYGYAPKGSLCINTYDWQGRNQTNAIGVLYGGRLFAVGLFDCSINSRIFDTWVEQLLIPQLPDNSVVVMDNAVFHKGKVEALLKDKGHTVLWLPPYSPDLNPIEKKWAWLKAGRRKFGVMSVDELFRGGYLNLVD